MNNYLPSPEAARRIGLKPHTLRVWRMAGRGPAYTRLGGPRARAVYEVEALEAWLRERTFRSTSEELVAHANEAA
jgi:transposase-like protein